jgi:hypothetical protein
MPTHWERFREASVSLAGCGPVKQRLLHAYQQYLADLSPEELPRELRLPFAALTAALHRAPRAGSRDAVSASVLKMSEEDACRHAQEIVRMFGGLMESQAPARPATLLRAVPDDPVPALISRA